MPRTKSEQELDNALDRFEKVNEKRLVENARAFFDLHECPYETVIKLINETYVGQWWVIHQAISWDDV